MHSAQMSRLSSMCETANVGIGTKFKGERVDSASMKQKLETWLKKHGDPTQNNKSRIFAIWKKIKAGLIPEETAAKIRRDHKREFAKFEKMEAMLA